MSQERRRYSRFPVHPDEGDVQVQIGPTVFRARVQNQSASGMQVLVAAPGPGPAPGTVVWVQSNAGCTEARVMRVTQDEKEVQLGLERLQDVPNLPSLRTNEAWWKRLPTFIHWDALTFGAGLALVLCVCGVIFGVRYLDGEGSGILGLGAREPSGSKTTASSGTTRAAGRGQDELILDLFQRISVVAMVKELRLTAQQQVEFRAVMEAFRSLSPDDAANETEVARLCKAHERMTTGLSPSQLAYWKATLEKQLFALPTERRVLADRQALLDRLFPKPQAASAKPR